MTQEILQAVKNEDYSKTIELLTDFIKSQSEDSVAHAALGLAYFAIEDFINASVQLKIAIDRGHVSRRVYVAYADTLCQLRNLGE
jgi:uncharacterized protein HemY